MVNRPSTSREKTFQGDVQGNAALPLQGCDFQQAYESGVALKAIGASVAVKAGGIHATYLVASDKEKVSRYEMLARLAEGAIEALPTEANSHYRHAFALGRYSQCISITKALALSR